MSLPAMTYEEAARRLAQSGYRMTRPREMLLRLILESSEPFSVKALHERAEGAGLNMHLATVHRNLAEFVAVGLIDHLPGEDNRLYALHKDDERSAHVYCIDCHLLVPMELDEATAREALGRALLQQGFDASSMRLMLAAHCQSKGQGSAPDCAKGDTSETTG